ncbi:calcium-binding protein [Phyllobacterium endophyticum]|uniref:calcium-binding protein n=1 Tax=Phyllobacterium endophyticum TaxID=1149773 RepID=UPI00165057C1|nr:calcium-binding protein [Phyllobacterium endophyticum]
MALASQLPQSVFKLLGIWNGDWLRPTTNRPSTDGHDDLTFNNLLTGALVGGGDGNDRIHVTDAAALVSAIEGGNGSDQIFGNSALVSIIDGGNGNDYIHGGAGADTLSGGAGIDTLSYEFSNVGVNVDMFNLTVLGGIDVSGGDATGDIVSNNFDNVVGSAYNDEITGNEDDNILIGLAGDDTLRGDEGNDTLIGGAGADSLLGSFLERTDTVDYSTSPSGVRINSVEEFTFDGYGGDAEGDKIELIDNITGSNHDDVINGSTSNNVFRGGGGNDFLYGGAWDDNNAGGRDTLIGGAGSDSISCFNLRSRSADDTIVFESITDSLPGTPDVIDMDSFDTIHLAGIDANPTEVGDQAFIKVDNFTSVAGQLVLTRIGDIGYTHRIYADINGDTIADMEIRISDGSVPIIL